MAYSPVDIPIQEILQTDFVTDIAQIHNSNVLLLKDKIEDLLNNFEIDLNGITIGTDNPINNIKSVDYIIQDGGFIYQTGIPNKIIARLSKNGNDESVLNVDNLTVDLTISVDDIIAETVTVNSDTVLNGEVTLNDKLNYNSAIIESKEAVSSTLKLVDSANAEAVITLTNSSKRNIYVKLEAETAIGPDQVFASGNFTPGLANLKLVVDFDANNPPEANQTFTIYIVDVIENSGSVSVIDLINAGSLELSIEPGVNQSTSNDIIMHYDLVSKGKKLSINYSSPLISNQALIKYGANATFNYILDEDLNDRLIITSATMLEII